jgi:hypothetical protein
MPAAAPELRPFEVDEADGSGTADDVDDVDRPASVPVGVVVPALSSEVADEITDEGPVLVGDELDEVDVSDMDTATVSVMNNSLFTGIRSCA